MKGIEQKSEMVNGVDLGKLCLAVCIVGLHTNVLNAFSPGVNWYVTHLLFRLGVPFFFIASGYFLGKKLVRSSNSSEVLTCCLQYCRKNLPPFLIWGFIGLIYKAFLLLHDHESHVLLKLVQTALCYPQGAVWFLSAAMLAVLVIGLLWNHKWLIVLLSVVGYAFALLCNTYFYAVDGTRIGALVEAYLRVFVTARNFFGVGLIYMGLGIWLASERCFVTRLRTGPLILIALLLEAVLVLEVWFAFGKEVRDDSSCFIVLPLLTAALFALALRIKAPYSMERSVSFRRFSANLYYLHPPVNNWIGTVAFKFSGSYYVRFAVVLLLCVGVWLATKNSKNRLIRTALP